MNTNTLYISTRAPTGGATGFRGWYRPWTQDFYSRPHGRGDEFFFQNVLPRWKISTRAPTGGATFRMPLAEGRE